MRTSRLLIAALALNLTGCDTSAQFKGSADDGEEITGVAIATGAWDTSGTVQLVGNRGLSCVGRFQYEGVAGPNGKATFTCNNGQTGEAMLYGVTAGRGEGSIGTRKINFKWGRGTA